MPYIDQETRQALASGRETPCGPGELNYALTQVIVQYMEDNGLAYSTINDVVGALEGAKLEFYRRIAVPYEDKKIEQNGDVYNV